MKTVICVLAAALMSGPAFGRISMGDHCSVSTEYDLALAADGLHLSDAHGNRPAYRIDRGHLFISGSEVKLDAKQSALVSEYEGEVRRMVPEARQIAVEAVGIAFTAIDEVAQHLVSDAARRDRLHSHFLEMRDQSQAAIVKSADSAAFNDSGFQRSIESSMKSAVAELVPAIVGDIVAEAVAAAMSGDEKKANEIEARAHALEREIETKVEAQAKQLEARADGLCSRVRHLDEIETSLTASLGGSVRFDIISTK